MNEQVTLLTFVISITGQELEGKRGFFVFPFFPSNPLH